MLNAYNWRSFFGSTHFLLNLLIGLKLILIVEASPSHIPN